LSIFQKSVKKVKVSLKLYKHKVTSHEDQYTFLIISRLVPLRMKNASDNNCREP